ncbi:proteasome accessory factor PafA2 [Nakamurella flavida]|uniref:Proteasome accessory factor PafA2 n=1 Tax=Nakamurella flavida TaxID=363630 RepID=A0A938YLD0_9ACTN|nr:depupylase/deamidase Dop [Nakamurella flavida]MBM9475384.1 proteasome accessory factor PafA2 [Nakamurella flavida]MDP9776964.1 proteasome accessory factor A [Nakamurella flavida]
MSVRRILGTEVEYGISVPGDPTVNPVISSTQIVLAYAASVAAPRARRPRWDYEVESPLRDARGYDLSALFGAEPDLDDVGAANVILSNGARLYVDHAHPEFSAPEVTNPLDGVLFDKAGERVMEAAAQLAGRVPTAKPVQLYKNNVDGKGASYGTHENYLCRRDTPFPAIIAGLIPFFASRQVFTGSGRVGLGPSGAKDGYQLSQRSDYIEVEVGLETTLKRGIINTRDEPHADADKHRRLHVIIGDANLAEMATYLKLGTTALVLAMIEDGWPLPAMDLAHAVGAVHEISHDTSLTTTVALAGGGRVTALDIQRAYRDAAAAYVADRYGDDADEQTVDVLHHWGRVLDQLATDPLELADELDWPAKLRLLEGFRARDGLSWGAPRLALVDLQYSDVRLDKGLYNRLVSRGSMKRLVTEEAVIAAMTNPPEDTRAYFRGRCVAQYADKLAAASWDSVIFDVGRESLVRIPTLEPTRGTRAHVGALLDAAADATELVDALTRRS